MKAKLQRRIQRYGWDRASDYYEQYWKDQLRPAQKLLLEMARLRAGEVVLDVACGTGLVSLPAAEAVGAAGLLVGTDLSQQMIDRVSEAACRTGAKNVRFDRMDAEQLSLSDDSFDAVLCALGLMYFPEPGQALQQMWRVLRPGGRALIAVWGRRDRCGWADIFPIVDSRVETEVCPLFFRVGTGKTLVLEMKQAGFSKLHVERIQSTLHYPSGDAACGAAFAGGPVALAYSRFDEQTRQMAHHEYLDSIQQYRSGDGYAIPGEFVVARGWKPGQAAVLYP